MPNPELDVIRDALRSRPRPVGWPERRARLDALGAGYTLPPDVTVTSAQGGEWTQTPVADPARVILFFHGGGYCSGSLQSHRHLMAEAGRQAHARTFAVDYRLAPEHPYPAALDDARAAYRALLDAGVNPARLTVAGESAGGGLAVALLTTLHRDNLPLPACLWLTSPWTDLAMTGATMDSKAAIDPLISRPYLQELATAYLQGHDPADPLVSPIHADLTGLPPMLIQVGTAETLLDDSIRLAATAAAADVRVTLQTWPDMIHAWDLFHPQLSDGRASLAEAGLFIRAHTG